MKIDKSARLNSLNEKGVCIYNLWEQKDMPKQEANPKA